MEAWSGEITSQRECQEPNPGLTPACTVLTTLLHQLSVLFQNRSGQIFQAVSYMGLASSLTVALDPQNKDTNEDGVFTGSGPTRSQLNASGLGGRELTRAFEE